MMVSDSRHGFDGRETYIEDAGIEGWCDDCQVVHLDEDGAPIDCPNDEAGHPLAWYRGIRDATWTYPHPNLPESSND